MKLSGLAVALCWTVVSAGCGDVARTGRSPVQVVVTLMEAAKGNDPNTFFGNLNSDVLFEGGAFNDLGRVTMRLTLKDPGIPGITATPSGLNEVTFTRYRVVYKRADGRNTFGVDVPHPFESAVTFTVPATGTVTAGFELVRIAAKLESPLRELRDPSFVFVTTLAEVTFFGRDQVGNDIIASGSIGVVFGDFGDE